MKNKVKPDFKQAIFDKEYARPYMFSINFLDFDGKEVFQKIKQQHSFVQ